MSIFLENFNGLVFFIFAMLIKFITWVYKLQQSWLPFFIIDIKVLVYIAFKIVPKTFIGFALVRKLLTTFKDFQYFRRGQSRKFQCFIKYILIWCIVSFLVVFFIIFNHFINQKSSLFYLIISKVIFLRNIETKILLSLLSILKECLRLKNSFVIVNLESFTDNVVSLISGNEWCKKYLSITSCYRDWIIKYNCIVLFLYFQNVSPRYLKFCFTKKYIWWVEPWMEK